MQFPAKRFVKLPARTLLTACAVLFTAIFSYSASAHDESLVSAAETYHERCALCHGAQGFGDGLLPMYIGRYPNTSLLTPRKAKTLDEIRLAIALGGTQGGSDKSPPWIDELSAAQIDELAELVLRMREDRDMAFQTLDHARPESKPSKLEGRVLFKTYCSRCHGEGGYGDGRMARVYKNPPPFPLVYSVSPHSYLTQIITGGGASVGRSEIMPTFKEQLRPPQIQSVIMHLYSIRQLRVKHYP